LNAHNCVPVFAITADSLLEPKSLFCCKALPSFITIWMCTCTVAEVESTQKRVNACHLVWEVSEYRCSLYVLCISNMWFSLLLLVLHCCLELSIIVLCIHYRRFVFVVCFSLHVILFCNTIGLRAWFNQWMFVKLISSFWKSVSCCLLNTPCARSQ